ncbi:MAG: TonB-dependent receptor plug domain-containing protein, partial [Muribaculaceae bacterium]|nr:TonB-dependent receptor plug domain-containing protein [Muribaculaceae bacterium]
MHHVGLGSGQHPEHQIQSDLRRDAHAAHLLINRHQEVIRLLPATLLLLPVCAAAETAADSLAANKVEKKIEEIVVTATRTPKSLKDVPVVTRLITADEIKKTDASNIQDLLAEELPGLEFTFQMSQETSLNMNGFGGKAVLFLVDGERLAGETMDNIDFNRLNLENVGQVEIVKGASSALYGANAVGGVVNLISRDSKEPWRVNLNS